MHETDSWYRFNTAEMEGAKGIKRCAKNLFEEWKDDKRKVTDLVMCINHKSWDWNDRNNTPLMELYADLYYEYYDKALNYFEEKGNKDAIHYFITTLD